MQVKFETTIGEKGGGLLEIPQLVCKKFQGFGWSLMGEDIGNICIAMFIFKCHV